MKRIAVIIISCLLLAGCKSKANNPVETVDTVETDNNGIGSHICPDGVGIISIADMENEMSADLFKGSYDDELLASLIGEGSFKSSINVFVIYKEGKTVLVDAGLGSDKGGRLMDKLSSLNINPERIDAVLLTHLHSDHIGGLLNNGQAAFPNAQLYLSVDEFNAWADGGPLAERNEHWKEVLASYSDKINLFQDGDTLLDGLAVAMLAVGHTPGHTVYQVGDVLFIGDLAHAQELQFNHPEFCAKYDGDYTKAVVSRKRIFNYAQTNHLTVSGAHCFTPFIMSPITIGNI